MRTKRQRIFTKNSLSKQIQMLSILVKFLRKISFSTTFYTLLQKESALPFKNQGFFAINTEFS